MIDIHTHCLPQIDDGPKSVDDSLKMLEESYVQGITKVVATPHCVVHADSYITKFLERRQRRAQMLIEEANNKNISIPKLVLGAEVYLDNDISRYSEISSLCIKGTNYMLIEPETLISASTLADWIYNLTFCNVRPIIAHIDRYKNWRELMKELKEIDVVYQINASRLLSFVGRGVLKKILANDKPFVVASDMHNLSSRPQTLAKAKEKACRMKNTSAIGMFEFAEQLL